ncbi:hypothetical protein BaRGS_00017525 [Batillaria attramentaria]|uniref:Uncharacterized protein n=1 Tax=Batillaria attramentaria TaxID=370345 RepID=A0ABD0KVU5_9CAEN
MNPKSVTLWQKSGSRAGPSAGFRGDLSVDFVQIRQALSGVHALEFSSKQIRATEIYGSLSASLTSAHGDTVRTGDWN